MKKHEKPKVRLEKSAVNQFLTMWADTDVTIEAELKSRGETFLPGNAVFDQMTTLIETNRLDRENFERAMSDTITDWSERHELSAAK